MEITLEQFADIIDCHLESITYSSQRTILNFKNSDIKEKGVLIGAYGDGINYLEARKDYVNQIKGKKIVIDAFTVNRKEFNVPTNLI